MFALSFVVFHHHFQPDVTVHTWVQRTFQILTLFIFIPSTLHVFNWIASLWQDRIPDSARSALPFKFMIAAIFFLIIAGVTGFLNAQISVDSDFIHNRIVQVNKKRKVTREAKVYKLSISTIRLPLAPAGWILT